MNLTGTIDLMEALGAIVFLLAVLGGGYNAVDAWRNLAAVLRLSGGNPPGRLVAIALDDLLRSVLKLTLLAVPGLLVTLLLMLIGPADDDLDPARYTIGIVLRAAYIISALGLLAIIATSMWLRRFLVEERATAQEDARAARAGEEPRSDGR